MWGVRRRKRPILPGFADRKRAAFFAAAARRYAWNDYERVGVRELAGYAGPEAAEIIRSLVSNVSLLPGAKRGAVRATLHGNLAGILTLVAQKNKNLTPGAGVRFSVFAGERNPLFRTVLQYGS